MSLYLTKPISTLHLPESPASLSQPSPSPSPSSYPADWSSLLQPLSAFPTPPDSIEAESWEIDTLTSTHSTKKTSSSKLNRSTPTATASSKFLISLLPPSCGVSAHNTLPSILHRGSHLFTTYTIAMSGCILDALSSKFTSTLLQSHPSVPRNPGELIILTALLISTKFLNDRPPHNIHFAVHIFEEAFPVELLTLTERCMLQDVNYRLGYLCAEGVVGEKLRRLENNIREEKKRAGEGWEDLDLEIELDLDLDLQVEVLDDDDVVDNSRMLAVFTMDADDEFDD